MQHNQHVKSIDEIAEDLKVKRAYHVEQIGFIDAALEAWGIDTEAIYQQSEDTRKSAFRLHDPDYDPEWIDGKKFTYFLNKFKRFLHFREVADLIIEREGLDISPVKLARRISGKLDNAKKSGVLVKYQADRQAQNTFWGYHDWMDEKGNIKRGYEFNRDYYHNGGRLNKERKH